MIRKDDIQVGNILLGKKLNGSGLRRYKVLEILDGGIAYWELGAEHTVRGFEVVNKVDLKDLMPYDWLEGLPLSEELFNRLGFKKMDSDDYVLDSLGVRKLEGPQYLAYYLEGERTRIIKNNVEFVHQLQNHYYGWTGKKLELQ